jgi:hypothetical protein
MQFDNGERALRSRRGRVSVATRFGSRPASKAEPSPSRWFGAQGGAWWAVALRARAVRRSHAALLQRDGLRATWSDPRPGRQDEWHRR